MRPVLARTLRRLAACSAAVMVTFMACRDATGPGVPRFVQLALSPRFQVGGGTNAQPISRIRLTARAVDDEGIPLDRAPVAAREFTVNPNAAEWALELNVPTGNEPARVITEIELVNLPASGEPVVEWAGRSDVITVGTGERVERSDIQIGRGPLPNLDVEAVAIGEHRTQYFVGETADFAGTMSPGEIPGSRVFWGALDPAVASIDASGRMQALAVGTARITLTAGLRADTTTVTVVVRPVASSVVAEQGNNQTGTVGSVLPVSPRVLVTDAQGAPVAGVTVTFAVTGGNGTISGGTTGNTVTNASGLAGLSPWVLGQAAGANTLTATVAGLPPVTFTATGTAGAAASIVVVSGSNQNGTAGAALAQPIVAQVRDQFANPVAGVAVTFASPSSGASFAPATTTTNAQGQAQATWTTALGGGATQTATATAAGITTPATFTATVTPPPNIVVALGNGADKVSLGRSNPLVVTIPFPAPTGGVQLSVVSSNTGVLTVVDGPTLIIQPGQSQGTIDVQGITEGNATVTATLTCCVVPAPQPGSLATSVEARVIGLPTTLNVPYGQTASLPINLLRPAPAGGLVVSLTTSDASRVSLAASTVTIPAGSTTATITVNGVLPGPSTIIASHPLYTPDTTAATTTAALDLTSGSYALNASFGTTATVRFTSNGSPVAAPAPGVTFTAETRNPACVALAGGTTIATGLVTTDLALTYPAGGAALPCTTRIVVTPSQAGIAADSATVTVSTAPAIGITTTATLGAGLQRFFSFNLGASNHGGVTVRVSSPDPARALVSTSQTAVGTQFVDIPITNGFTQGNYYVQVHDTATGTIPITLSAPGFTNGVTNVTIQGARFDLVSLNGSVTTLSGDDPVFVRTGIGTSVLSELQERRPGVAPYTVTLTTSDPAVAQVVSSTGAATTGTSQIVPATNSTPNGVALGGLAVRPIGNGTATITATIPGLAAATASGSATVTVTTPGISFGASPVGAGLQRAFNVQLLAPAPAGGVTVSMATESPSLATVSASSTAPGGVSASIVISAGNQNATFYVHGMNGQTGTAPITVSAPGYAPTTTNIPIVTPALDLSGLNSSTTTLTPNDLFAVRIGVPNGQLTFLQELQAVRAGGPSFPVTVVSDTPSVATLVTSGGTGGTATLAIVAGQNQTPGTLAGGGVELQPLTAGLTTVRATATGAAPTSNATLNVTVTQPTQNIQQVLVGAGLMRSLNGSLGASDHGGVTVTLTSADPSRLLLAPNATTAATASITVPVANGNTSYTFYVHGVEGQTGSVNVTATTPGFATFTRAVPVQATYVDLVNLQFNTTTLSADDQLTVRSGIGTAGALSEVQEVRFGGTPITVTVTSSTPGVAAITPSSNGGASGTATIAAGTSSASTLSVDPLTAGTTTIGLSGQMGQLAIAGTTGSGGTLFVTAPGISFTGAQPIGSGLQRQVNVNLGAAAPTGGRTVTITSSQPSVLVVSNAATTAGAASTTVTVAAGQTSAALWVQGMDGVTGTVTLTATASGYTDGTVAQAVVQPALDVISVNTTTTTTAADDAFQVRVGVANANGTALNELLDRRAGGAPLVVTATSTNAAVGLIATSTTRAASGTAQLVAGQSATSGAVSTGGFAFDAVGAGTTTVTASIPGFLTTATSGNVSVTVTAALVQAMTRAAVARP